MVFFIQNDEWAILLYYWIKWAKDFGIIVYCKLILHFPHILFEFLQFLLRIQTLQSQWFPRTHLNQFLPLLLGHQRRLLIENGFHGIAARFQSDIGTQYLFEGVVQQIGILSSLHFLIHCDHLHIVEHFEILLPDDFLHWFDCDGLDTLFDVESVNGRNYAEHNADCHQEETNCEEYESVNGILYVPGTQLHKGLESNQNNHHKQIECRTIVLVLDHIWFLDQCVQQ